MIYRVSRSARIDELGIAYQVLFESSNKELATKICERKNEEIRNCGWSDFFEIESIPTTYEEGNALLLEIEENIVRLKKYKEEHNLQLGYDEYRRKAVTIWNALTNDMQVKYSSLMCNSVAEWVEKGKPKTLQLQ